MKKGDVGMAKHFSKKYGNKSTLQKRGCNIASVVLLKLHGCVVSHMQVLATTLLSVHNLLNTHFAGPLQLKDFILATCF